MRQWTLALAMALVLAGCDNPAARQPNRANFTAALNDFLAQRGHLCLAKYQWPITVAADSHTPDAEQMPVLEQLGLVTGSTVRMSRRDAAGLMTTVLARTYRLSAEGQHYYLHVPVVIRTATQHVTHPADFCAATLTLDRLIGWDPPQTRDGRTVTSLLFTYHITPAPWARTPAALQAFPVLARAMENAGAMQLRLGVHVTRRGWVADELDAPSSHRSTQGEHL